MIGLIVCGYITGWMIASIVEASKPPPPDMEGKKVGIMKDHEFEGFLAAKHGGLSVGVDGNGSDPVETIVEMTKCLRNGSVEGLLFDKTNLWYLNYKLLNKNTSEYKKYKDNIDFFLYKTIRTIKFIDEPRLVYGILVKEKRLYDYLSGFMRDNYFVLQQVTETNWLKEQSNKTIWADGSFFMSEDQLISARGTYFQSALIALSIMIFFICLFGVVYEMRREKYWARKSCYKGTNAEECASNPIDGENKNQRNLLQ